jgi:hypothetical protein
MSLGHLATTTSTRMSRRRTTVLTPPSLEPDKTCRSRACCSKQRGTRRAKAPKDHHTRATAIANEEKRRLERTPTKSNEIRRRQSSTRPPVMLEAPPRRGIYGEGLIPSLVESPPPRLSE